MIWIVISIGFLSILGLMLYDAEHYEEQTKEDAERGDGHAQTVVCAQEDEHARQEKHRAAERAQWAHERRHNRIVTGFSIVAAGAAVVAAAIAGWAYVETKRQADANWEQIKVSTDQTRRSLRAYVFVSRAVFKKTDDAASIRVYIENFGQTPAHNVKYWIDSLLDPQGEDRPRFIQSPLALKVTYGVLPPRHPVFTDKTHPFDNQFEKFGFPNGTHVFYAFGHIDYEDAYGRKCWTNFRFKTGGIGGFYGEVVANDEQGNEADTDCE